MSESAVPGESVYELDAQIERRHSQPDLCTIYRSSDDEMSRMSRWITAKGQAFVDAKSHR